MSIPLSRTSRDSGFSAVFTEVAHSHTLGLMNAEQLRLFHLAVQSNRFSHRELVSFLQRNLGRYVFSRAEIAEYAVADMTELIVFDAAGRMNAQGSEQGLGELMLYILLEQILGAPKVLSKIEINQQAGRVRSRCDAIHLFTPDGSTPVSSIVFGTSSLSGDIQDAIDDAFDKIVQIETNSAVECQLAEEQIFTTSLDEDAAKTIKELLIPQPGGAASYDSAYGIFLGYDIGLEPLNYKNDDYRRELGSKMALDITHHAAYIANKITTLNLGTHAFYVYVLPFDNSDKDSVSIMDAVLQRGGRNSG
ncbi:DUF1837 domain-containing protein [Schaalia cardiffensis]|uniref:HamA C-terminal domain-containing protein n=1 Tax=Schaalia cardiffensis TaxID=181487 RepID=UPI002AB13232|nr:DUF1837 domain-containing protein [Schaalia cardiffensis]